MPFKLELSRQWTQGSHLSGPEDLLPDGAIRLGVNVRLDRSRGVITSRPGLTALSSALAGSITRLTKLFGAAADYAYAQIGAALYRLTSAWGTPTLISSSLSGTLSETNFLD